MKKNLFKTVIIAVIAFSSFSGAAQNPEKIKAHLVVDSIVKVNEITCSPEYLFGSYAPKWHIVSLVESTGKYYVFVDNKFVSEWNKAEFAVSSKYNSAMFDNGKWVPAILSVTKDNSTWKYVCRYADGSGKMRTPEKTLGIYPDNIKYIGMSPYVKTMHIVKKCNGKKHHSVNVYNNNGDTCFAYSVTEK